jgi:hypothetical protein
MISRVRVVYSTAAAILNLDIPSTTVGIHQRRDAPVDFTNFCSLLILIAVAYCDCDMESHGPMSTKRRG